MKNDSNKPAWIRFIEKYNGDSPPIARFLLFFNIPAIILIPLKILYAKQNAPLHELILWAAICVFEIRWYDHCDFPWQRKKKEDQDDRQGST